MEIGQKHCESKTICPVYTHNVNRILIQKMENKKERTKCERYSRVVGYLRPVAQWNEGKQAEFEDRKTFNLK